MLLAAPLLLVLFSQAEAPVAELSPEVIAKAVRDLAADDFKEREKATELLWRAGPAAIPALEKAAKSDDFEVKFRAQNVLDKVRYGIMPDTPADVAKMLETFRKGDLSAKQSILLKLRDRGEMKILLQLLRAEKDPGFQRLANDFFRSELDRLLPDLLAKGDYDQAEQLLAQSAVQDASMQRLAAWWLLRGKADEQATKLKEKVRGAADLVARRQLVWLLRAKGDLAGALAEAEKVGDVELVISLAVESGDWKKAAKLKQEALGLFDAPLEEAARVASWHRLAGNDAEFKTAAAALQKRAEEPAAAWLAAKSLLLNERAEEGINVLRKEVPDAAFRLLAYRSDFEGALQLAAIEPGTPFTRDWYKKLPSQERAGVNVHRFVYAADIMRQLHWLGRKEQSAELRKLLLEIAADPETRQVNGWGVLASMELRGGMEEESLADAALALNQPGGRSILAKFFPKHYGQANLWWDFLSKQYPSQNPRETLAMLMQLLRSPIGVQPPLQGWEEIVAKAADKALTLDPPHRGQWQQLLAEACEIQGNRDRALKYAKDAVDGLPIAGLTYGRLLADDKQWDAAAAAYLKVWEGDKSQVVALHLAGKALMAAGKPDEGKAKLELASLMCLDANVRRNLAYNLHERALSEDALVHYELAIRTGQRESWHISNAAENIGNLVAKNEPLRAADMWERLQLFLLSPTANPTEFEPLLDIGRLVHKTRARGYLEAGKSEKALAEIKLCEQICPGNVDVVEDIAPLLKAHGLSEQADQLYERAYAIHAPLAEKFPQSAACRNNVAWLSAVCHQRLDEALAHAQKAVELAPQSASYLDTLAEVYFQKGDRAKAVALGKEVIKLAPASKLFAERLKHFENDPLPQ